MASRLDAQQTGKWDCTYRQHSLPLFIPAESSRISDISVLLPNLGSIGFAPDILRRGRCALSSVKSSVF